MKVVFCLNSINYIGGIENATLIKAKEISKIPGIEVFIAVSESPDYSLLSSKANYNIIDLKINYYKNDWKSPLYVWYDILFKRIQHKKVLTRVLNEIKPDIVISVGQSEKYFLPEIKGDWKTIREFHYEKFYRIRNSETLLQKCVARIINYYEFNFKVKKYDKIIVLTNEDKIRNWNNNNKIAVIPNIISVNSTKVSSLESNKIIAVGRLVKQKNFISLIRAFKFVSIKHPNWYLYIYGEGELKNKLQDEINKLNLETQVKLVGKFSNYDEVYGDASLFVMTSIFEGLPLALLEAISFGLPVVSYDFQCGPKDIITNGLNGYLVNCNNEILLSEKICDLIENKELRKMMGASSLIKSKEYSVDKIIKKILTEYKEILHQ